ncbi:MAG: ROK family protein [Verrucomicrobiales bacterium]
MTTSQVIGIDFGGTSVKLAVVEGETLLTDIHRIPTQEFESPDHLIERISRVVAEIREQHPSVSAIGVGVPGAVNFSTGMTYNLTNVKGWSEVPLRDILAEESGLPTVIDNDANCMAYAEWKFGAARGCSHAVCVTLGTGVGGGLILNNQLFRGANYAAGEIGQMSIDLNGVPGPYGNTGALERYIGNRQITEMAAEIYRQRGEEVPAAHTPEALAEMAGKGDPVALEVWTKVATCLGFSLMSVVYLLNPEAIVIGGGVSEAGALLFDPLKKTLKNSLTAECFDHLRIVPARFGNTAGMIGSSAMASELC